MRLKMLEIAAGIGGVVAFAAAFLWIIEKIARFIGGRNTWLLFLVALPFLGGAFLAYANRVELKWWQILTFPFVAPMITTLVLTACIMVINPFDTISLLCASVKRALPWMRNASSYQKKN